ncbi:hypothetical protein [Methylocystis sp. JR02]|uniref:hypothetical protein n=1 Tax=Methylocystis sp. JR02 TaxID=3046284 RepID=UPI0024B8FC72|nr:hypothetical protein [Methylocystis sp. JR02]MDJ0450241.1 hypothetical protein [Methylocystis sp. JR02]
MVAKLEPGASESALSIRDKLRFLCAPAAYPHKPAMVQLVETHMSYVFLAGARAYKLKKPVRYPFLDFSTIAARERDCREELRLNRRLSEDVYLDVTPLKALGDRLSFGDTGEIVDWLVEMRRLPGELMLDALLRTKGVRDSQITAVCETLAQFYRRTERSKIRPQQYMARFAAEQDINRAMLTHPGIDGAPQILDRLDARLAAQRPQLEARVTAGRIVDGHGDLRPEHICLTEPVVIFDCLEFNAELRQVDPFDEVAFLGVECAQLGALHLLRRFIEALASHLEEVVPPWDLIWLYAAWRAALRARLSIAHLLDASPRHPEKWAPLANRYLGLAARALDGGF